MKWTLIFLVWWHYTGAPGALCFVAWYWCYRLYDAMYLWVVRPDTYRKVQ